MPGSECSKLLAEIEVELTRSNTNGSSGAANFWRASTIRILESLAAATTQNQQSPVRESVPSGASTSRVVTVVEGVLRVLSPFLNPLELNQFKVELSQIAAAAISVWVDAQADEQDFIVNSVLYQSNSFYWKPATFRNNPSYPDNNYQPIGGLAASPSETVFTLFPIILCEKRIQLSKAVYALAGSYPEDDEQPYSTETILVHDGLGLAEKSELVQRGVKEKEDMTKLWEKYTEGLKKTIFVTKKGHSRNNSTDDDNVSGPPSPSQLWKSNGRNQHATEV